MDKHDSYVSALLEGCELHKNIDSIDEAKESLLAIGEIGKKLHAEVKLIYSMQRLNKSVLAKRLLRNNVGYVDAIIEGCKLHRNATSYTEAKEALIALAYIGKELYTEYKVLN